MTTGQQPHHPHSPIPASSRPSPVYRIAHEAAARWACLRAAWTTLGERTVYDPRFESRVAGLAAWTSRRPGDADALESRASTAIGVGLLLLFLSITLVMIGWGGRGEVARWATPDTDLIIAKDSWHVLLRPSDIPCPPDARGSGCLADPERPDLWRSPLKRSDDNHVERVRAMAGKTFWIGTRLAPDLLKRAYEKRANVLVLGWLVGTYRVFADGSEVANGAADDRVPIVVSLSASLLTRDRAVPVAIEIAHDSDSSFPDMMDRGKERLSTGTAARHYIRYKAFIAETLPAIATTFNLLIALMFAWFWLVARKKQEYLFLAVFCAVSAMIQAGNFDWVYRTLGFAFAFRSEVANTILEASFGLFLGLAYARAPLAIFQIGIPVAIAAAGALPFVAKTSAVAFAWAGFVAQYVVPTGYGLGAALCLIQALHLVHRRRHGGGNPARVWRLVFFAAGLAAIVLLRFDIARLIVTDQFVFADRFLHMGLVFFLSMLVVSDYGEQARLVRRYRVSKYHRRVPLPATVAGWMVKVDLKKSTSIAQAIGLDRYGDLVSAWYGLFVGRAVALGGEVMSEEGDAISVFFDDERGERDAAWVVQTVRDMLGVHPEVETIFALPQPLHLRAAAMRGIIRPIWKGTGDACRPAWDGTILIDCARILELERDAPGDSHRSRIVLPAETAPPAVDQPWARFSQNDKDGKLRALAVLQISN